MMKLAIWTVLPVIALLAACSNAAEQAEQRPDLQSDVGEVAADAAPQNKFGFHEELRQGPEILRDGKADARLAA